MSGKYDALNSRADMIAETELDGINALTEKLDPKRYDVFNSRSELIGQVEISSLTEVLPALKIKRPMNFCVESPNMERDQIWVMNIARTNTLYRLVEVIFDRDGARELELYIENCRELYHRQTVPVIKNMQRKIARGIFDAELAVKLVSYLVESGAKLYCKEFCSPDAKWYHIFDKPTRLEVARRLARGFEAEIRLGNLIE